MATFRRKGGYIRRCEEMLASPAYRDLKPPPRCLLEEFQRIYRPQRNGKLSISTRTAKELLNVSSGVAEDAFYDLVSHGFIKLKKDELWQERKAREWALTFEPIGNREPTDEWKNWTPDNPYKTPHMNKKTRPTEPGQCCPEIGGNRPTKPGQD